MADVRTDPLELSDMISECPFEGDGQHWDLLTGPADRIEDPAWSLPRPGAEGMPAHEHVCFYPDKVELTVEASR